MTSLMQIFYASFLQICRQNFHDPVARVEQLNILANNTKTKLMEVTIDAIRDLNIDCNRCMADIDQQVSCNLMDKETAASCKKALETQKANTRKFIDQQYIAMQEAIFTLEATVCLDKK